MDKQTVERDLGGAKAGHLDPEISQEIRLREVSDVALGRDERRLAKERRKLNKVVKKFLGKPVYE